MPNKIIAKLTLSLLFILFIVCASIYAVIVMRGEPKLIDAQVGASEQSALAITRQLIIKLAEIEGRAAGIAVLGAKLPPDADLIKPAIEQTLSGGEDSTIAGGGLWPEPYTFTPGTSQASLYWARTSVGKFSFSDEYNAPEMELYQSTGWYKDGQSAKSNKCVWSDTYVDPVTKALMTTCSVGYSRNGVFSGVATIDLTLSDLADFLKLNGGITGGYAFAIDRSGRVLFLPKVSPGERADHSEDMTSNYPWFWKVLEWGGKGEDSISTMLVEDEQTFGSAAYVSLIRVADTGWIIGLVTPERTMTMIAAQLRNDMLLILIPLLIILFGILWLTGRSVLRLIGETTQQVRHLGSHENGGLLPIDRDDEVGELRTAVNDYARRLQGMLENITSESVLLQKHAETVADLSTMMAERAERQRQDNTMLATAVTQMAASALEVARNTTDCSETAQDSLKSARASQSQVERNGETIGSLRSDISQVAAAISQLGVDIESVSHVLDVIKSISAQTNLLALNAAIEAARAGEQGRGFAVVADEVRTLAGRTQSSADQIHNMITELRQASDIAVSTMVAGETSTQLANEQAGALMVSIEGTITGFDAIVRRAQQIAVAAQEQSHVT
jgi:methyl-accepting chemotaxis protein